MPRPASTRHDEGKYRQYVTEEQRRQVGCSAGRMPLDCHYGLLASRFASRDLYRAAVLSWMMPLADILSISETVPLSADRASSVLPWSIAARSDFNARRSRVRSPRFRARRTRSCWCAFNVFL